MKKFLLALLLAPSIALAGFTGGGSLTIPAYLGTACNNTLYPASLLCVSNAPTTDVENHNIGIMGGGLATYTASGTPLTGWGVGLYGKGWTNGNTRSAGTVGEGMVTASGDVGSAVGLRGYAKQTHAGGMNIGVLGDATGGLTNYDLYSVNGTITSATGTLTNTGDLVTSGKLTVGSGVTGLVVMPWIGGGGTTYSALYNASVTPSLANPAILSNAVSVYLNGVNSANLSIGTAPIVSATSAGAAVNGALSSTGVITASAGVQVGAGTFASGKVYTTAVNGTVITGAVGSVNDVLITNAAGNNVMRVPTGTQNAEFQGVVKISNGYTVATLPAGAVGQRAYVTDALAPTFLGTLTGGGSVVTPVFHNGTAWVAN